jgi:hypothetical protein
VLVADLLGDSDLGVGVLADLLDHLALLANDATAEAIVSQQFQYDLAATDITYYSGTEEMKSLIYLNSNAERSQQ